LRRISLLFDISSIVGGVDFDIALSVRSSSQGFPDQLIHNRILFAAFFQMGRVPRVQKIAYAVSISISVSVFVEDVFQG
jgi:hypothetical protein